MVSEGQGWRVALVGVALAAVAVVVVAWRRAAPLDTGAPCDQALSASWVAAEAGQPVGAVVHRLPGFCEIVYVASRPVDGRPRVAMVAAGVDDPALPRHFATERAALFADPDTRIVDERAPDGPIVAHGHRFRVVLARGGGVWLRVMVGDRYIPPERVHVAEVGGRLALVAPLAAER